MVNVLFVCMGNICRSPTAHGVFENLVKLNGLSNDINIDSAGTHAYHVGEPPDKRAQAAALNRGVDLSSQRARRVQVADFECYDYILAMDHDNFSNLIEICPTKMKGKIKLFLSYSSDFDVEVVPDPYYGGSMGFEQVLDMVESASAGLLTHIRQDHFK